MRQCVICDRGYYENALISQLLEMREDFPVCGELALDVVQKQLCRSAEIVKVRVARNIYLNALDDVTRKILELLAC